MSLFKPIVNDKLMDDIEPLDEVVNNTEEIEKYISHPLLNQD